MLDKPINDSIAVANALDEDVVKTPSMQYSNCERQSELMENYPSIEKYSQANHMNLSNNTLSNGKHQMFRNNSFVQPLNTLNSINPIQSPCFKRNAVAAGEIVHMNSLSRPDESVTALRYQSDNSNSYRNMLRLNLIGSDFGAVTNEHMELGRNENSVDPEPDINRNDMNKLDYNHIRSDMFNCDNDNTGMNGDVKYDENHSYTNTMWNNFNQLQLQQYILTIKKNQLLSSLKSNE